MRDEEPYPTDTVRGNRAAVARTLLALGLRLEIQAREPRSRDCVPLAQGERLPHLGAGDRVEFRLPEGSASKFRSGVRVRLELDGLPPVPARVRSVKEDRIQLVAQTWLGSPIPGGQLVEDTRWILRSLRWRLLSCLRGRNDELALALLGTEGVPAKQPLVVETGVPGLNAEQQDVVDQALRPGVCLVHGPPGTGKTRTLGAAVEVAVREGRTVLCTAPSNIAADRLLDAIAERLQGDPRFANGLLLRLGQIRLEGVRARWGRAVDPWCLAMERLGEFDDPAALRDEVDRLIRSCAVLVTTVARSHLVDLRRRYDLVILDEAVMTALPGIYHVATLAAQGGSVVVAGDPHQLPAVARSRHPLVRQLFTEDPFRLVGSGGVGKPDGSARVLRLSTQYRMDAPIASMVNVLFYGEGRLRTHPCVGQRDPLNGPVGGAALLLLDSSAMPGGDRKVRRYGNRAHADLIAQAVEWITESTGAHSSSIAVLTRYRDQVETIRSAVKPRPGLTVDTVHGLQGGEVDTVILDFTASPEHDFLGDYLADADSDAVGARLLTVALTRARRRIVLVADVPFLMGDAGTPPDAVSRRVLEYVQSRGRCIGPEDMVVERREVSP